MTSLDPGEFTRLVTQATEVLDPTPPPLHEITTLARRRRRRMTSIAVSGTVTLLGAAAAAIAVLATPGAHDTAKLRPAAPPPAGHTTQVTFGSMVITLPAGWSVASRYQNPATTNTQINPPVSYPASEDMCIAPNHNRGPQVLGCGGIQLQRGAVIGAAGSLFVAHQPDGWYNVIDVLSCPTQATLPGGGLNALHGDGAPIMSGFADVGGRRAVLDEYHAHCDSGTILKPRSWYLPTSHYGLVDYLFHPETAWILAHIRWTND